MLRALLYVMFIRGDFHPWCSDYGLLQNDTVQQNVFVYGSNLNRSVVPVSQSPMMNLIETFFFEIAFFFRHCNFFDIGPKTDTLFSILLPD